MPSIEFRTINWNLVAPVEQKGETGTALIRTLEFGGLRLRMVEYGPGYAADHWCTKGHFVHCLTGTFVSVQAAGEETIVAEGMSYIVSDDRSTHRSHTTTGASLLIIDGDFLRNTT